jgi:hypothetical protein
MNRPTALQIAAAMRDAADWLRTGSTEIQPHHGQLCRSKDGHVAKTCSLGYIALRLYGDDRKRWPVSGTEDLIVELAGYDPLDYDRGLATVLDGVVEHHDSARRQKPDHQHAIYRTCAGVLDGCAERIEQRLPATPNRDHAAIEA